MKPHFITDDGRVRMRGCLYSECAMADNTTPVYMCDKQRKGNARKPVCVLYEKACKDHETFPERFDT